MAVPLEPGDCLFFSGLLPHGTPSNVSGTERRAIQLHYAWSTEQGVGNARRLELFDGVQKQLRC